MEHPRKYFPDNRLVSVVGAILMDVSMTAAGVSIIMEDKRLCLVFIIIGAVGRALSSAFAIKKPHEHT